MAASLILASTTWGASEPLTGGTTSLGLKKGFANKLNSNDVKVLKAGNGKVKKGTVELKVNGGVVDAAAGKGYVAHSGGFKLKQGKATISITAIEVDLDSKSAEAKVGGKEMKLGNLKGISVSGSGSDVKVDAGNLKLTGAAAKAINKKLGLGGALKGGNAFSSVSTKATAAVPTPFTPPEKEKEITPPPPPVYPPVQVKAMTRNLYLGADLTPAILAPNAPALFAAAGVIWEEVENNDFPTRSKGLANEILTEKPDLVGLQEVALWREGPVNMEVLTKGPSATTVKYDYLTELMNELNAGGQNYEVVYVQGEFDFEVPADTEGDPNPDLNGRLTMRDVIIKRSNAGVETTNAKGANFGTLFKVKLLGGTGPELPVLRGWTSTEATVRGSRPFRFVNTHLEAFHPQFRAGQAWELVQPPTATEPLTGPVTGDLPVILVGDLNSDDDTVLGPSASDRWAYNILIQAGLAERSTDEPMSCCINSSELGVGDGGSEADFDHHIDHIMTSHPTKVTLLDSVVTGIPPENGFWNSDHAGVTSTLEVLP